MCDPKGKKEADKVLPGYKWFDSPYKAAKGSHLIVILTEWNEFRGISLSCLKSLCYRTNCLIEDSDHVRRNRESRSFQDSNHSS